MLLLCGSLLYYPAVFGVMTINKFLFTQAACLALAMVCAIAILLRRGVVFSMNARSVLNKQLFSKALPFAIIVFLMAVHYRLDGFLLERIHKKGSYETGIYAGAIACKMQRICLAICLHLFYFPILPGNGVRKKICKKLFSSPVIPC